jgi:hypothetical protein
MRNMKWMKIVVLIIIGSMLLSMLVSGIGLLFS